MMRRILHLSINILITIILVTILLTNILGLIVLGVVEGSSMEPLLQTGDVVIIITTRHGMSIDLGDIIVFTRADGRGLVIHRVIKIVNAGNSTYYITKGDNNMLPDYQEFEGPGIPRERVLGKVLEIFDVPFKIPLIGYLSIIVRRLV